jgi:hypothetical protein
MVLGEHEPSRLLAGEALAAGVLGYPPLECGMAPDVDRA